MNQGVSLEVYDNDEAKARASLAAGLAQHGLADLVPTMTVSSHETAGGTTLACSSRSIACPKAQSPAPSLGASPNPRPMAQSRPQ